MTAPGPTWVVGAGGLLGRHVARRLPGAMTVVDVPWLLPERANSVLRQGIHDLLDRADGGPWNVAWCAGAGVVGSSPELVEDERVVFERFVADLATAAGDHSAGAVFFASSAGGLYADSIAPPFTEHTEPRPRTPYGRAKLAMEQALRELGAATATAVLIGRIANLYGPGQDLAKPQGLVSQICLTHLTGQPLSLYVSADTRRDYLYVDDCARMVAAGLAGLRERPDRPVVKVMASGRSVTAGGLIGESTRLFRRRPRVVFGASAAARLQVRDIRLRSVEWTELDALARTPLPVGIARTAEDVAERLRAAPRAVPSPRRGRADGSP
jgi:UDP-glucose 4-epimerase